ncbi:hypothetical protein [Paraburkholderia aromaticivorans]|jgi:hypothetical protein|uniref:hypothetical protein n=1 Tax=Paraburkholderia aromaticivorans TaxID=2026199 RepID=UPI0038B808F3
MTHSLVRLRARCWRALPIELRGIAFMFVQRSMAMRCSTQQDSTGSTRSVSRLCTTGMGVIARERLCKQGPASPDLYQSAAGISD